MLPNHPNILVTLILSESTASLLKVNRTNEEFIEFNGNSCILKPIMKEKLKQINNNNFYSYVFKPNMYQEDSNSNININTAYFCNHFDNDSKISMDSYQSFDSSEIMFDEASFEKLDVFTRPLIILKIKANEECAKITDNTIIITLFDDQLSVIDSELICRICHGGESNGDLISPCRCKGTIALTHEGCLERWLKESSNSYCELCQHHFQIIRKPKYGKLWSVLVYLVNPGDDYRDLLLDTLGFIIYTPTVIISTYMMMQICENMAKYQLLHSKTPSSNMVAICAIFGMAAIDFTYSSWLIAILKKHISAWSSWYKSKSYLKIILPKWKRRPYRSVNRLKFEQELD